MIQKFGGNGLSQTAQWFETNEDGLGKTSGIRGMVWVLVNSLSDAHAYGLI